jgi:glycosyltransferase 2 family protein
MADRDGDTDQSVPAPRRRWPWQGRVRTRDVVLGVATVLAGFALLRTMGDPVEVWHTLSAGNAAWILFGVVVSLGTNVAAAVGFLGAVPGPLPFLRTVEMNVGMSFANLAVPGVGGVATQIRYLQKDGMELSAAVAAGGLVSNVGLFVGGTIVFVTAVALSPAALDTGEVSGGQVVVVFLVAALVVGLVGFGLYAVPGVRRRVAHPARVAWVTIRAVLRSPRKLTLLIGGWIGNGLLVGLALDACAAAFAVPLDYWTATAIGLGVTTLANAVSVPGGSAAVGSVGTAGALSVVGVDPDAAVAVALTFQVVVTILPALPGWFAIRHLMSHDHL